LADSRDLGDARLGYFAHERDGATFRGALAVLSLEGDPVDLVYTDPVSVSRLTQALLGPRLDAYMLARVLAEPLLAQAKEKPAVVCFEDARLLLRHLRLGVPAVVMADPDAPHRETGWRLEQIGNGAADRELLWVAQQGQKATVALLEEARRTMAPFGIREPFRQVKAAIAALAKEAPR
jgi:hypothetical protein